MRCNGAIVYVCTMIVSDSTNTQNKGTHVPPCLPMDLIEDIGIPVIMQGIADHSVHLNSAARVLWDTPSRQHPDLHVVIKGQSHHLLTYLENRHPIDKGSSPIESEVYISGNHYNLKSYLWNNEHDQSTWRVVVFIPVASGSNDGAFFRDKIGRLKAIVHELRNTITSARDGLGLLQEDETGTLNRDQQRFLDSATDDLNHLVRTLTEITSLWVTQAGMLRIIPQPCDIRELVEKSVLGLQPLAKSMNVSLQVQSENESLMINIDPQLIKQSIRNILTNALQHTNAGDQINVRAYLKSIPRRELSDDQKNPSSDTNTPGQEESIVIHVHDSGVGISAVDQKRIFMPFEKGIDDSSEDTGFPSQGMGLGLTIAREIVEQHGGSLDVKSTLNEGSCFTFTFPIARCNTSSWMSRSVQRAIEDVRPLRVQLACVLICFNPCSDQQKDLLFSIQQIAVQNLRDSDTVLCINENLLLMLRGGTKDAAENLIERIEQSKNEFVDQYEHDLNKCPFQYSIKVYPEDGRTADQLLQGLEFDLVESTLGKI